MPLRTLPRRPSFSQIYALAGGMLIGACDREHDPVATPSPARHADAPRDPSTEPSPSAVAAAEPEPSESATLAIGDAMPRIDVIEASGARSCASCEPGPRLLVITGADAARQDDTVRDLDAIARFWADNGLATVIVLTDLGAVGAAPLADAQAEAARAEAARLAAEQRLGSTIAAAIAATPERWSPSLPPHTTAVLVDRAAKVAWVGRGEPHWRGLDTAIAGLLAVASPR
ncbi:MAG: hypothetical protein IPH07_01920 [Deltaproteobacteria bacterium]|nr:hypothetical protein [Deltaproteobacteria bacterium]MBP7290584.1 hypothetical protein [Nannocystaceae bacterium]